MSNQSASAERSIFVPSAIAGASLGGLTAWAAVAGIPSVSTNLHGAHHRAVFAGMFVGALGFYQYAKSKRDRLNKAE